MEALVILAVLVVVSSGLGINAFIGFLIYKELKKETVVRYEDLPIPDAQPHEYMGTTAEVTTDEIPLDQFTPDFTKPLNVKIKGKDETFDMEEANG